MSKNQLPKIKSLLELRRLATTDGPLKERYVQLAITAAMNLGYAGVETLDGAMRHLKQEADCIGDDEGVVSEVNFVRDIEAER